MIVWSTPYFSSNWALSVDCEYLNRTHRKNKKIRHFECRRQYRERKTIIQQLMQNTNRIIIIDVGTFMFQLLFYVNILRNIDFERQCLRSYLDDVYHQPIRHQFLWVESSYLQVFNTQFIVCYSNVNLE